MDLRQEIEHIFNNGYAWYEDNLGSGVVWHEFDSTRTEYHGTYDEGGRVYTAGVLVPVLWVIVTEADKIGDDGGRKPTERLSAAVSMRSMDTCGISDPEDYTRHLNDIISYDGRLWGVSGYQIRGNVPGSVVIGVTATQVFADEEMVFDQLPPGVTAEGTARPYTYPNNAYPDFIFHDGPGAYDSLYINLDSDVIVDGGTP